MMIRKLTILLTSITLVCCSGKSEQTKTLICLNNENSQFVNTVIEKFDAQLTKQFGRPDYKTFLNDMSNMDLPPDFFVDSDLSKFLNGNRNHSGFKDIWNIQDDSIELNTEGEYFNCLKSESHSKTLSEILDSIDQIGGISPGLIAGALASELPEEQYKLLSVRTFIAINLYSELSINLFDMMQMEKSAISI